MNLDKILMYKTLISHSKIVTNLKKSFYFILRYDVILLVLVSCIYTELPFFVLWKDYGIPSKLIFLFLLMILFTNWIFSRKRTKTWVFPAILIGCYIVTGFISLSNAIDLELAVEAIKHNIRGAMIVIMVIFLLRRIVTFRRVIWTLLATGIIMGTITVYQQLTGTFDNSYWGFGQVSYEHIADDHLGYRSCGPIGDPNYYAQVLVFLLPLAIDRLWSVRKFHLFIIPAWVFFTCGLAFVFTYSRGGFIALIVVLMLMGIRVIRHRINLLNIGVTVALLLVMIQFIPSQYINRTSTTFRLFWPLNTKNPVAEIESVKNLKKKEIIKDRLVADYGFRGRLSENIIGWQLFTDHPFFGVGIGNYEAYYQRYSQLLEIDPRKEDRETHNLYLEIAAETGVPGLITFSIILVIILRGLRKARKTLIKADMKDDAKMVMAFNTGIIGYLTAALFLHAAFVGIFWMIVGIAFTVPQIVKHELSERQRPPSKTP